MVLLVNFTFVTKGFLNQMLFELLEGVHILQLQFTLDVVFFFFFQNFVKNHNCSFSKTGRTHGRPPVAGKDKSTKVIAEVPTWR